MVRQLRGFRAFALLLLVMVIAVSCAGKSVSSDGADGPLPTTGGVGSSGSGGTGATGAAGAGGPTDEAGGTGAVGATGGVGGNGTGATGASGAVGATGGTAGTGGDSPSAGSGGSDGGTEPCTPPDAGGCSGISPGYYFDTETGQCQEFETATCIANRFLNRGACLARCAGGEDRTQCNDASECVLLQGECCGCSSSLKGLVAVSKFFDEEFPGILTCPEIPCPPCEVPRSPYLFVTCEQTVEEPRHCAGYDARQHAITECVEDSDCRLRRGLECCECSGVIVSVNVNADIEALVCGSQECAIDCDPAFPSGIHPVCRAGRCDTLAELL